MDCCILELIITTITITTSELQAVNRCRLYLQVIVMSDILNPDRFILPECWKCLRYTPISSQRYTWPCQNRPGDSDVLIWQKVLFTQLGVRPGRHLSPFQYTTYFRCALAKSHWRFDPEHKELWEAVESYWKM